MNFYRIKFRTITGEINTMGVAAVSMVDACRIFIDHFDDMDCSVDQPDVNGDSIQIISCTCEEEFTNMMLSQFKHY